jgi:hypothetical protein
MVARITSAGVRLGALFSPFGFSPFGTISRLALSSASSTALAKGTLSCATPVDPHIADRFRYDGYKLAFIDQCSHPCKPADFQSRDFCSACRAKSIPPRVPKWEFDESQAYARLSQRRTGTMLLTLGMCQRASSRLTVRRPSTSATGSLSKSCCRSAEAMVYYRALRGALWSPLQSDL